MNNRREKDGKHVQGRTDRSEHGQCDRHAEELLRQPDRDGREAAHGRGSPEGAEGRGREAVRSGQAGSHQRDQLLRVRQGRQEDLKSRKNF